MEPSQTVSVTAASRQRLRCEEVRAITEASPRAGAPSHRPGRAPNRAAGSAGGGWEGTAASRRAPMAAAEGEAPSGGRAARGGGRRLGPGRPEPGSGRRLVSVRGERGRAQDARRRRRPAPCSLAASARGGGAAAGGAAAFVGAAAAVEHERGRGEAVLRSGDSRRGGESGGRGRRGAGAAAAAFDAERGRDRLGVAVRQELRADLPRVRAGLPGAELQLGAHRPVWALLDPAAPRRQDLPPGPGARLPGGRGGGGAAQRLLRRSACVGE